MKITMKVPATLTVAVEIEGENAETATVEQIRAAIEASRLDVAKEIARAAAGGYSSLDVYLPGGNTWLNVSDTEVEVEPFITSHAVTVEAD